MIRLAILKPTGSTGDAVRLITDDAGIFEVVLEDSSTRPSKTLVRDIALAAPEAILLDVGDWPATKELLTQVKGASRNTAIIGYRGMCTAEEEADMENAGIATLLPAPFSAADLDTATHMALHQRRPLEHPNILAFLPSKAGSGCSTVVLNTAAALANGLGQRTLLIEGDRRSGVLSMLLNIDDKGGLPAILAQCGKLTPVEWRQHLASIGKLDMLLANPLKPGPQPTWATYFQILDFVKTQYDFILVDLPELINPATSELTYAARNVFVVCEPELASLKLVGVRGTELAAAGVAAEKICVLGNRWEGRRLTKEALEETTHVPMYAALPNDYLQVKNAAMESRLVAKDSAFGKACVELARRVSSMQAPPEGRVGSLLRRFGRG
jgi:Mrp family chromosome partitioning ATPase